MLKVVREANLGLAPIRYTRGLVEAITCGQRLKPS